MPVRTAVQPTGQGVQGDGDAVGADAEEHRMGEGDDAGVAQHDVVARGQHDEDADALRHAQRLGAGEQERGAQQGEEGDGQQDRQDAAAGAVAGKDAIQAHDFTRGNRPRGRHSRIATISRMLEPSASLGSRKPV